MPRHSSVRVALAASSEKYSDSVAPNNYLYVIDEIYGGGIDIPRLNEMIHRRNAGRTIRRYYADPQDVFSQRQQG